MMNIAAYTVGTRQVGVRRTAAAVILSACDLPNNFTVAVRLRVECGVNIEAVSSTKQ